MRAVKYSKEQFYLRCDVVAEVKEKTILPVQVSPALRVVYGFVHNPYTTRTQPTVHAIIYQTSITQGTITST